MGKRGASPLPTWRTGKGWQVKIGGTYVPLGVRTEGEKEAAYFAWHRLMAGLPHDGQTAEGTPTAKKTATAKRSTRTDSPYLLVSTLMARWMKTRTHIAESTRRGYRSRISALNRALGGHDVPSLTPSVVSKAMDHPRWSAPFRGDMLRVLRPAICWAIAERLIDANPIKGMKASGSAIRTVPVYTEADFAALLAACRPPLADIVSFLRATGCRPCEARSMTVGEVDIEAGVVRLANHKTAKKTGRKRVIVVPASLLGRVRELCTSRPSGKSRVFVKLRDAPWERIELAKILRSTCVTGKLVPVTPYSFRHLFITDALVAGVPIATVAALVGHTSTAMISRVYSHLTDRIDHLREQIERVH